MVFPPACSCRSFLCRCCCIGAPCGVAIWSEVCWQFGVWISYGGYQYLLCVLRSVPLVQDADVEVSATFGAVVLSCVDLLVG